MAKKDKHDISTETHQSNIAETTLQEAIKQATTKHKQHGDTVSSFAMIAEMWTTYVKNTGIVRTRIELGPSDVAQMMVILKMCRSVYGTGHDNYIDGAGYTALASMLQQDNLEE